MNPGRAPGPAPISARWSPFGWPAAAAGALALHAALLWLLLPHGAGRQGVALADPPLIEVEMVEQVQQTKGRPAAAAQPTPPPPAPPEPSPDPSAEPAPKPPSQSQSPTDSEPASQPPPSPPAPPAPPKPPAPAPPAPTSPAPPTPTPAPPAPAARAPSPAVNLGDADEDQEALRVTGDDVVPPSPNAAFHNKAPSYPLAAARRHHEGVVLVRVRVGTAGVPESTRVGTSSGDPDLDRAAVDAVQLWRFQPARENGVPVPFDYEVNINFRLGDR